MTCHSNVFVYHDVIRYVLFTSCLQVDRERNVFVGNLPSHYTKNSLHKIFQVFGNIREVKLIRRRNR